LALWLILPTVALLAAVIGYPVIYAVVQSLKLDKADAGLDATGFFQSGGKYVGSKYYSYWFNCGSKCPNGTTGHEFWPAVSTTVIFTVITVIFEVVLGTVMALVMHRAFRGRSLVRAAILVPWAIPTAVTALMWKYMFQPHGVINAVLGTHIIWTGSEWPARWAVIIADVSGNSLVITTFATSSSGDWGHFVDYCFRADGTLALSRSTLNTTYGGVRRIRERRFSQSGTQLWTSTRVVDLVSGKVRRDAQFMGEF